jgi:hypothetical protein
MAAATANKAEQSTTAPATSDQETAGPSGESPRPVAIGFNPELGDPLLVSCRGGSISFVTDIGNGTARPDLEIHPGLNTAVDPSAWARARRLESVQQLLVNHVIEEIPLPDEFAPVFDGSPINSLEAFTPVKAQRMIHHQRDVDTLAVWLKAEGRPAVRQAIARRQKELNQGGS